MRATDDWSEEDLQCFTKPTEEEAAHQNYNFVLKQMGKSYNFMVDREKRGCEKLAIFFCWPAASIYHVCARCCVHMCKMMRRSGSQDRKVRNAAAPWLAAESLSFCSSAPLVARTGVATATRPGTMEEGERPLLRSETGNDPPWVGGESLAGGGGGGGWGGGMEEGWRQQRGK